MKTVKLFALVLLALHSFNGLGQQKWSLRTNTGITSGTKLVDGYYFSFDLGIPLSQSLEISPTFTSASMLPNTYISNDWNLTGNNVSYAVPVGGPRREYESGKNLSSISLLLLFKPFKLMKNEKLEKHELIIGAGISYNSYTRIRTEYEINGNDYDLTNFSMTSNRTFEPYYCKLSYNYLFKENLFLGATAGIPGFDGEGTLLSGLQFGIKFN